MILFLCCELEVHNWLIDCSLELTYIMWCSVYLFIYITISTNGHDLISHLSDRDKLIWFKQKWTIAANAFFTVCIDCFFWDEGQIMWTWPWRSPASQPNKRRRQMHQETGVASHSLWNHHHSIFLEIQIRSHINPGSTKHKYTSRNTHTCTDQELSDFKGSNFIFFNSAEGSPEETFFLELFVILGPIVWHLCT